MADAIVLVSSLSLASRPSAAASQAAANMGAQALSVHTAHSLLGRLTLLRRRRRHRHLDVN